MYKNNNTNYNSYKNNDNYNKNLSYYKPLNNIHFCIHPYTSNTNYPKKYSSLTYKKIKNENIETTLYIPKILKIPTPKYKTLPLNFYEPYKTPKQYNTNLYINNPNIKQIYSIHYTKNQNYPKKTSYVQKTCLPPLAYNYQNFLNCLNIKYPTNKNYYQNFYLNKP